MATTSASWRTRGPLRVSFERGWLQFGHDVSVVENSVTRRSTGTRAPELQFGHDVSVVENVVALVAFGGFTPEASIWPRRQRRGELAGTMSCPRGCPCFNLATTSASWRTGSCARRTLSRSRCFNLATTSASWRTYDAKHVLCFGTLLQFGHDVSVVENVTRLDTRATATTTLQFGHDVSVVENEKAGRRSPAGGGASIWPRRQRRGEHPTPHVT